MIDINDYSIDDIRKDIARFKNDTNVNRLNKYYKSKSMAEVLGVSRKEIPHSNFLKWILDPNESHSLGKYSIKKLLDIYVLYSNNANEKQKELFDLIITDSLEIDNITIEVEKSISAGRLDIFIEVNIVNLQSFNKIRIIIENKVTANETSDQTSRYYEYFESNKEKETENFYIYLTPISTLKLIELEQAECTCKEFTQINYQTLVDLLFEPILIQNISEQTKYLIQDYLHSLSQPSYDENNNHQEGLIMAIGNEERELLKKFWDNNQNLILASLYSISSDPDQEKDVRDSISDALENISSSSKDRSLINIKFDDEIVVSNIKKSDIGYQTVKLIESNNLMNDEVFEFLRNDKSSSFLLLKQIDEMTDTEVKYRKYRNNEEAELIYHSKEYYVARNWGIGNIGKFINKIESKFPTIKFEVN